MATWGTCRRSARPTAWVPLPAPGPPSRTMTLIRPPVRPFLPRDRPWPRLPDPSSDEAFVVAHHQLGLDLLHRLDHDRDHDEQARAAQPECGEVGEDDADEGRRDGHDGQEQGAGEGDAADDAG